MRCRKIMMVRPGGRTVTITGRLCTSSTNGGIFATITSAKAATRRSKRRSRLCWQNLTHDQVPPLTDVCLNWNLQREERPGLENSKEPSVLGSLGIAVEKGICGGCLRAKPANNPHIWPLPRQIPERLSFGKSGCGGEMI